MIKLILFFIYYFFSNNNILIVSSGKDLYNFNSSNIYILNNSRFSIIYDKKNKPKLKYKEYV